MMIIYFYAQFFIDNQVNAHATEQFHGRGYIMKMRNVSDRDLVVCQQRGGENRQRCILST